MEDLSATHHRFKIHSIQTASGGRASRKNKVVMIEAGMSMKTKETWTKLPRKTRTFASIEHQSGDILCQSPTAETPNAAFEIGFALGGLYRWSIQNSRFKNGRTGAPILVPDSLLLTSALQK
jgi:hypothetical protein